MSGPSHHSDPFIGVVVGERYRVLRQIGRGGMGAIYQVENTRLGRQFALKRLAAPSLGHEEALARFRREADAVARLRHPNVVDIIDWDTAPDGSPCIIMELLEGMDLRGHLAAHGPLPWPLIARVADQITSALATAHRNGIIHRDLKPQNVFVVDDDHGEVRAKLLDFGVAKIRGQQGFVTGTNDAVLGTPAYMSPEQANAQLGDIGPATDVWAMGAVLYELATAKVAFVAESPLAILYRICHGAPDPLLAARPDAPAAFVDTINRALTRDPTLRIASMDDLRAHLGGALGGYVSGGFSTRRHDRNPTPLPLPIVAAPTGMHPGGGDTISATWKRATGEMAAVSGPARPGGSRRGLRIGASMVGAIALVGLSWMALRTEPGAPAAGEVAASQPAQVDAGVQAGAEAGASTVAPPGKPSDREAQDRSGTSSDAGAEAALREPLVVTVAAPPKGLKLSLDDRTVTGPRIEIPRDGLRHRVSIGAPGYQEKVLWLDPDSAAIDVRLERLPRAPIPARRPDSKKPPGPLLP